ncbi:hypothetical protein, partial [Micrococcus luteus]
HWAVLMAVSGSFPGHLWAAFHGRLQQWDEAAFRASIPAAREKVEFAARFCEIGPSQPRWDSHRPVVELIFYLCKLDYDIKVLLLPS